MNFTKEIETQKTDILHSGCFYWVHAVARCYRINEVDHYLKDLTTNLLGFLDNQGRFHHFNRIESQFPATTSFEEVLGIPNIKKIECFEIGQETVEDLKRGVLEPSNEDVKLLKKVVDAFYEAQRHHKDQEFSLVEWKSAHMKEYIHSNELES